MISTEIEEDRQIEIAGIVAKIIPGVELLDEPVAHILPEKRHALAGIGLIRFRVDTVQVLEIGFKGWVILDVGLIHLKEAEQVWMRCGISRGVPDVIWVWQFGAAWRVGFGGNYPRPGVLAGILESAAIIGIVSKAAAWAGRTICAVHIVVPGLPPRLAHDPKVMGIGNSCPLVGSIGVVSGC